MPRISTSTAPLLRSGCPQYSLPPDFPSRVVFGKRLSLAGKIKKYEACRVLGSVPGT